VAAGKVVVALGDQHFAGQDQLLLDIAVCFCRGFRHFCCPSFSAVRATYAAHDDAACVRSQDNGLLCGRSATGGVAANIFPAMIIDP
jgi:hypothetical protein